MKPSLVVHSCLSFSGAGIADTYQFAWLLETSLPITAFSSGVLCLHSIPFSDKHMREYVNLNQKHIPWRLPIPKEEVLRPVR